MRLESFWEWCVNHPGPAAARLFEDGLARADSITAARQVPTDESGFFYQDLGNPDARDQLESLVKEPDIISIVSEVFSTDGELKAWFTGEQVFLKEANTPRTGWHQDISDSNIEGLDALVIWMCFDRVSQTNSLEVVRGSHLGPVYSSIYGSFRSEPIPDIESHRHDFDIASYACERGDVVLFHYGALHGGGPTGTDERRRTLALRFIGPDCRKRGGSMDAPTPVHSRFIQVLPYGQLIAKRRQQRKLTLAG